MRIPRIRKGMENLYTERHEGEMERGNVLLLLFSMKNNARIFTVALDLTAYHRNSGGSRNKN